MCAHAMCALRQAFPSTQDGKAAQAVATQLGYARFYRVAVLKPALYSIVEACDFVNFVELVPGVRLSPVLKMASIVVTFDNANGGRPSHADSDDARKPGKGDPLSKRRRRRGPRRRSARHAPRTP